MKVVLGLAVLGLLMDAPSIDAHADEVQIGHLETHDDTSTNWLYLHCDQQGPKLVCDAFQTLIYHELNASQREAEINKTMQGVANFRDTMGQACAHSAETVDVFANAVRTGKGADGREVSPSAAAQGLAVFKAMDAACRDTSIANIRKFAEVMADEKLKACKVHNEWSKMIFSWNAATNAWVLQEGPTGPCGMMNIGTLERDPTSKLKLWVYTEKKIRTKPDGGEILPGLSCNQFPETSFKYTWRSQPDHLDCESIESEMD